MTTMWGQNDYHKKKKGDKMTTIKQQKGQT